MLLVMSSTTTTEIFEFEAITGTFTAEGEHFKHGFYWFYFSKLRPFHTYKDTETCQ